MRQFPHAQSHIRMENVSEISLQCMENFSFLEKDLEVHFGLQCKHFFIDFIPAALHLGRILMLLIFPPGFSLQGGHGPCSLFCQCLPHGPGVFWDLFLLCVPFPRHKSCRAAAARAGSWIRLPQKLPNKTVP